MTPVLDHPAPGFGHEALFYRGDDDLLAGLLPYVREGMGLGESVVVALPRPGLDLLRTALGDDAATVEFLDMAEIGGNPAQIIAVWDRAVREHAAAGRGLRGIGEPAYPGRRTAELTECRLHELLLNRAFDDGPSWRLLCPYDEAHLPRSVTRGALHTHPLRSTAAGPRRSREYAPGEADAMFRTVLPRPTDAVLRGIYGPADLPATRRTVAQFARTVGLPEEKVEALQLAASELATNSVRHGGGSGTVAMWVTQDAAVVEFVDPGQVTDPLTGRLVPSLEQECGRGVFLVNQLCDLVQLRSSEEGTTIRVTTWV
ncbi:sensor histidine kinase [Blastococcus tunisiensis]|uniref:Anti-sigma regulatory factor (Ser/Thr protein kinase) n=1 Tax=Blastococcus tunisiensis TaxID=1798228 RepID=A0A1I2L6R2_9ACTN|nr:sensor histidine kinase [Blastococcus sp. DSM 46838]SFF74238.1 Anti-sigma regulatory factor (Ser/Thr protein kinase) [Blastococcus sp. DSM 46838]